MSAKRDDRRNLNPHKAAIAAMNIWGREYSRSGGGLMNFWDGLTESAKRQARELVKRIEEAPEE
jgi:hypothetical protein